MTTEVGEQFLVFNKGRFWVCRTSADVDFQVFGVSQDYKLRDIAALPMRHQNRTLGNPTENFIPVASMYFNAGFYGAPLTLGAAGRISPVGK